MSKTDGVHFPNYAPSRFLILRAGRGDAIIPALTSPTMPRGKLVFGRGAGGKGAGWPSPRLSLSTRVASWVGRADFSVVADKRAARLPSGSRAGAR